MTQLITRLEALLACRDQAGSDSQMARDLGVSRPTIWRWVKQSKQMPAEYVLKAEQFYAISRYALRPDIYPVEDHDPPRRWLGVDQGSTQQSAHL